jgi:hypothetical protein
MTQHDDTTRMAAAFPLPRVTDPARIAESLARAGVMLGGQRTELYRQAEGTVELVGWWTALGFETEAVDEWPASPGDWFPWSLGTARPESHMFVRNAGPLPMWPGADITVSDLGMGSAVHLPIHHRMEPLGAVCVYWASERDDWPSDLYDRVVEIGRDTLLDQF